MTINVFVSTVEKELHSARLETAKALASLGFNPIWCEYPDSKQEFIEAARASIDRCEALVQIVGDSFGPEPIDGVVHFGRVSYAQYETLFAIQSRKPVFFLICGKSLPRDVEPALVDTQLTRTREDVEICRSCQRIYREKCASLNLNATIIESLREIAPVITTAMQNLPSLFSSELVGLLGPVSHQLQSPRGKTVVVIPRFGVFETQTDFDTNVVSTVSPTNGGEHATSEVATSVELIDAPGLGKVVAESNSVPDPASWHVRKIAASKINRDLTEVENARRMIEQQIRENHIDADRVLSAFTYECVNALDEVHSLDRSSEFRKRIQGAERQLESQLQSIVRSSIGSTDKHMTYSIVSAADQSINLNYGNTAGVIGAMCMPSIGGFLVSTVGGLLGYAMGGPTTKEIRVNVIKHANEFASRLAAEIHDLLSKIGRERMQDLKEPKSANEKHSEIEVSVFSEERVQQSCQTLIQVFIHPSSERELVVEEAASRDDSSAYRGRHTLAVDVPNGSMIEFQLTANEIAVEEPFQTALWSGKVQCLSFVAHVPKDAQPGKVVCTLTVRVLDVPVGYIRFTMTVVEVLTVSQPILVGDVAHRYGRAFISYASNDLGEVLKRIQMLRVQGIEFFQDLLTLQPGEKWEARIYEEIEKSDLFLLFWSSAALSSEWVEREWRHAIKCRGKDDSNPPDIHPVIIEGPPIPHPPEELKRFHFRDLIACLSQYDKK